MQVQGKMSVFGGPHDTGVSRSEDLAIYVKSQLHLAPPGLFLDSQPPGTTGTARRLNPNAHYFAFRWDYKVMSKDQIRVKEFKLTNPKTRVSILAWGVDWGPNKNTGRVADLSTGAARALALDTDCQVIVEV